MECDLQRGKRPVRFESADDSTVVECTYDYMGRRHTRKVTVNGAVSNYLRYIYRGYLQIAAIDAVSGVFRWFLFWDPTQPTATRPLAIRKDGTWYAYGWDLTKNVTEVFGPAGYIRTTYTYTPYGEATATGDVTQPFTWSSEYADEELALIYYNYRHYNPTDGRWISRDPIMEQGGWNLYAILSNKLAQNIDTLGLWKIKRESEKMTASACAEKNDTWETLAQTVNLDEAEAFKWVLGYTPKPKSGKTYQIPNTLIQAWYGDLWWIGRRYSGWDFDPGGNYHVKQIFHSALSKNENKNKAGNLAMEYSRSSHLYGVYIYGHGNEKGVYWGQKGNSKVVENGMLKIKNPVVWDYESTKLDYRLAMVNFRACESADAKKYCAANARVCDVFEGMYIPMPIGWGF